MSSCGVHIPIRGGGGGVVVVARRWSLWRHNLGRRGERKCMWDCKACIPLNMHVSWVVAVLATAAARPYVYCAYCCQLMMMCIRIEF
jgi:hypothetical protein